MRLIAAFSRFVARLRLATRYWMKLHYGWHLAWMKAERS